MGDELSRIYDRMEKHIGDTAGDVIRQQVFEGLCIPEGGSAAIDYPPVTAGMVSRLKACTDGVTARRALTANAHGIPDAVFEDDARRLAETPDLETWLKDNHRRAVETLSEHADSGQVWFEQYITPAVAAWVKANPEVLGGVLYHDGPDGRRRIHFTKIPFDPDAWLAESDPVHRRYLYCHCPLARESLAGGGGGIDPDWCRCSAGFVKRRFDVAFGEETEAEVLESVMAGGDRCRFAITVPDSFPG